MTRRKRNTSGRITELPNGRLRATWTNDDGQRHDATVNTTWAAQLLIVANTGNPAMELRKARQ